MRCRHFDCGWCYYKGTLQSSAFQGSCGGSAACKACEPSHYVEEGAMFNVPVPIDQLNKSDVLTKIEDIVEQLKDLEKQIKNEENTHE